MANPRKPYGSLISIAFWFLLIGGTMLTAAFAQSPGFVEHKGGCVEGAQWYGNSEAGRPGGVHLKSCNLTEEPPVVIGLQCDARDPGMTHIEVDYLPLGNRSPSSDDVTIAVDDKTFEFRGRVDYEGMYELAKFRVPSDHPVVEALAAGARLKIRAGRNDASLSLAGSRNAIEFMRAACESKPGP
jgi:hypothetical protein